MDPEYEHMKDLELSWNEPAEKIVLAGKPVIQSYVHLRDPEALCDCLTAVIEIYARELRQASLLKRMGKTVERPHIVKKKGRALMIERCKKLIAWYRA